MMKKLTKDQTQIVGNAIFTAFYNTVVTLPSSVAHPNIVSPDESTIKENLGHFTDIVIDTISKKIKDVIEQEKCNELSKGKYNKYKKLKR